MIEYMSLRNFGEKTQHAICFCAWKPMADLARRELNVVHRLHRPQGSSLRTELCCLGQSSLSPPCTDLTRSLQPSGTFTHPDDAEVACQVVLASANAHWAD